MAQNMLGGTHARHSMLSPITLQNKEKPQKLSKILATLQNKEEAQKTMTSVKIFIGCMQLLIFLRRAQKKHWDPVTSDLLAQKARRTVVKKLFQETIKSVPG